ncbi:DNA-directed RNA polymerase I subunit RPA2 [Bacillus rossius redtenbacheri]|uniref:DNA-directed RNA polymerase I subunit RPA2 n=1 Tax=Bacillus rossius redtenbacheri TaxID=93214 RepID=UPI002FDCEA0B
MAATVVEERDVPSLKNLTSNFGSPSKPNKFLQSLGKPHIESFNFFLDVGLKRAVENLLPVEFLLPNGDRVSLVLTTAELQYPRVPKGTIGARSLRIFPSECRQRAATYKAAFVAKIACSLNGSPFHVLERELGQVPVMVKSRRCHLESLSPRELVERGEHPDEWGGYFIVQGHERLIRMLLMTRRNYPITVCRPTWKARGKYFSDLGVMVRSVSADETSTNNVLHYVTDGSAKLMFSYKRILYYAPIMVILKSLMDVSDEYIFKQLTAGVEDNLYYKGCVIDMLHALHEEGFHTHEDVKIYIGKTFRVKFTDLPPWVTNTQICDHIIKHCLAIHLSDNADKFHLLVLMMKKLFALVAGECCAEGVDGVMSQELLMGGHLYLQVLKEKLQTWLAFLRTLLLKKAGANAGYKLTQGDLELFARKISSLDTSLEHFLSTGNVYSQSGLGLMQDKGLTIVLENINRMRYMSHFKAVHRGSFFQEMRTTEVRQLLPDAWGFICPVHTPDGSPCGLLNHLTKDCQVTGVPDAGLVAGVALALAGLGMSPLGAATGPSRPLRECCAVVLDGRVLGHVARAEAAGVAARLRLLKIQGTKVPSTLEIALIPPAKGGQYPGLFLFTGPARMMRPVLNLAARQVELIGTLEQVHMDICIVPEEAYPQTTHQEISSISFLSNLACLIPMPDCNQSPRNMYQCQMGKQTMGTPCHTWHLQTETKMYRLQTPASPFFRPTHYDAVSLDDYAMGTNAIVAVISYTGYDMEDAMIINKASFERGFAHGSIYKSEVIDLKTATSYFGVDPSEIGTYPTLDPDGLPHPGTILEQDSVFYSYYHADEGKFVTCRWKSTETAIVDHVKLCGSTSPVQPPPRAVITVRVPRNPSVGDKFASRAGQKGICSLLWPAEDLPFTETGLHPDIIFNPHGFPSRMTIAMIIEVMAGKSAAIHGLVHDATPFKFSEKDTAAEYFGRMLEAGGYNYYGTEKMYSGIEGCEMEAAIFFGVVHYQRLRHMVSDKWQVRSTGPVDTLTRQPLKGRRRGGGVRFGEMERDALLAHGASFLLHDRLFHCSDKSRTLLCSACGSLLSPVQPPQPRGPEGRKARCLLCGDQGSIVEVEIPYIFRYFVAQLASVNIKLRLDVGELHLGH